MYWPFLNGYRATTQLLKKWLSFLAYGNEDIFDKMCAATNRDETLRSLFALCRSFLHYDLLTLIFVKQNRIGFGREIAFEQKECRDLEWIKLLVRLKQEKMIEIELEARFEFLA